MARRGERWAKKEKRRSREAGEGEGEGKETVGARNGEGEERGGGETNEDEKRKGQAEGDEGGQVTIADESADRARRQAETETPRALERRRC
jgi:hypothetical protein